MVNFQDPTKQTFLHSVSQPQKEADRFLNSFSTLPRPTVQVFIGLGALHLVDRLVERPDSSVAYIFWEPLESVFHCSDWQSKIENLTGKFNSAKIRTLFLGPREKTENLEEFRTFLRELGENWTYSTAVFPSYARLFGESLVQDFKTKLESAINVSNQSTKQHFERTWTYHYLRNTMSIHCTLIDKLDFSPLPLLFTGASPGLEMEIELIKAHRKKFVLLAGDTSLPFLLSNEVVPDLILSLDTGRGTLFHFSKGLPADIPILTWFGGSPHLFELPNPKWVFRTTYPMDQVLHHSLSSDSKFSWREWKNPGLNQATFAKELAFGSGSREFLYAGVSFLQESGRSHCRGTGYEFYHLPRVNRNLSLEKSNRPLYKDKRFGKNNLAWDKLKEEREGFQVLSLVDWTKRPSLNRVDNLLNVKISGKKWDPVFLNLELAKIWEPLLIETLHSEPSAGISLPALRRFLRGTKKG